MAISDDLLRIAQQERILQFPAFAENDAWILGCRLRDAAAARNMRVVIDIRRFGQPLFFSALTGSTPDNVEWARRKSNVVARFHRSSYGMGLDLEEKKVTLLERFGLPLTEFAAHGGAFPLAVSGTGVIGSIAVSGLPQREDHEFVVEMLCAELHRDYEQLRLR
ncbi:MAG TPA: heme-degrading domain-containing protein [Bryobacteraceae bacterium]|nr:heme-degrading domain-containing protein [Bryobacteraceae bacterium]